MSTNGLVEVTSGLNVSSRIISGDVEGFEDGDRIDVTSEDRTLGTDFTLQQNTNSNELNRLPSAGSE